jgi:hypothetical protein
MAKKPVISGSLLNQLKKKKPSLHQSFLDKLPDAVAEELMDLAKAFVNGELINYSRSDAMTLINESGKVPHEFTRHHWQALINKAKKELK